ncbi:hypothetical protein [Flavobacterium sp. ZB4P13]|uniref:hypothetical protein n=1 Tax=Flavobacterium sp. ZB4P13 TaxID=3401728 RepID=UPI003AAED09D
MSKIIKNALIKVTFDRILTNGKNFCWFKVKSTYLSYMVKYWRGKVDFRYLKIYPKNEDGSCGSQIGYITRTKVEF